VANGYTKGMLLLLYFLSTLCGAIMFAVAKQTVKERPNEKITN